MSEIQKFVYLENINKLFNKIKSIFLNILNAIFADKEK